ncbi:hypothetical protein CIPAW_03G172000 [Carya illinoinensis]|uniref:Uncharacterized protein n=1 Tax=Carya illinoinensis TaxID=32201 RepID=A0A8T1R3S1_CARIL|nr:hypothetical protein CIPAW_03G172000 [Carya illinoinensis]
MHPCNAKTNKISKHPNLPRLLPQSSPNAHSVCDETCNGGVVVICSGDPPLFPHKSHPSIKKYILYLDRKNTVHFLLLFVGFVMAHKTKRARMEVEEECGAEEKCRVEAIEPVEEEKKHGRIKEIGGEGRERCWVLGQETEKGNDSVIGGGFSMESGRELVG